jgi:hypothetical protein
VMNGEALVNHPAEQLRPSRVYTDHTPLRHAWTVYT